MESENFRGPVGVIQYYSGDTPPADWLVCNGQTISRTEYEELFEVIGTKYGEGDRSTTFQLPDLMERFVEGGTDVGTKKEAGLPNITGKRNNIAHWGDSDSDEGAYAVKNPYISRVSNYDTGTGTPLAFDASKSNPIYGNSETVQPASLTLLPIIRAR